MRQIKMKRERERERERELDANLLEEKQNKALANVKK
jgi:hypothetical protein